VKVTYTKTEELELSVQDIIDIASIYDNDIKSFLAEKYDVKETDINVDDFDEYEFEQNIKKFYNHDFYGEVLKRGFQTIWEFSLKDFERSKELDEKICKLKLFTEIASIDDKFQYIYYKDGFYYATNKYIVARIKSNKKIPLNIHYSLLPNSKVLVRDKDTFILNDGWRIYQMPNRETPKELYYLFPIFIGRSFDFKTSKEDGYYLIQTSKRDFKIETKYYELALTLGEIKSVKFADNRVLLIGDDFEVVVAEMEERA